MARGVQIYACLVVLAAGASASAEPAPRKAQKLNAPEVGCFLTDTTMVEARCKASDFDLSTAAKADPLSARYLLKMRAGHSMWVRARDVLFFDEALSPTARERPKSGGVRASDEERSSIQFASTAPPTERSGALGDGIGIQGNTIISADPSKVATRPLAANSMAQSRVGSIGSARIKGDTAIEAAEPLVPRCTRKLGTLSIIDGDDPRGWTQYNLASPQKLLRAIVQKSGCFNLVDRGAGLNAAQIERNIGSNLGLQRGSNVGQGQVKAADYVLVAEVQASDSNAGGGAVAGAIGGLTGGALVGGIKTKKLEANTVLSLTNVRTTETVAVQEGYAVKNDIGWGAGGGFGFASAVGSGYEDTEIGRVITRSFIDSYAKMVAELGLSSEAGMMAAAAPSKAFTAVRAANLRDNPSAAGKLIRTLPIGAIVYPTGKKQALWWEVADEGDNIGWVNNSDLAPSK